MEQIHQNKDWLMRHCQSSLFHIISCTSEFIGLVTTARTLAPDGVTSARWRRLEEVETCCPSLFMSLVQTNYKSLPLVFTIQNGSQTS